MRIDLHVHTTRYSACARMTPDEMAEAAISKGLDGVVLTEHNNLWSDGELKEIRGKYPKLRIFNAVEVTIRGLEDFLVYGVTNPSAFYKDISLKELIQNVRNEDGVIAIAHPYRYRDSVISELFENQIDMIEVGSSNILYYMRERILELQKSLGLAAITGSDGHDTNYLGLFAVDFEEDIQTEKQLAEALRLKRFKLHADTRRLKEINDSLDLRVKLVKDMLAEGAEAKEIREKLRPRYGISYSFIAGVKANEDMRLFFEPDVF